MNEQQYLSATKPQPMLEFLRDSGALTQRKGRLFAVACCRRIWRLLEDRASSLKTLDFAERCADGLATRVQLHGRAWGKSGGAGPVVRYSAWDAAQDSAEYTAEKAGWAAVAEDAETARRWQAAFREAWEVRYDSPSEAKAAADAAVSDVAGWLATRERARKDEGQAQARLLFDIFGNPFRPLPSLDPAVLTWNDGVAVQLARAAYDERSMPSGHLDPARLGVLADALEDAGAPAALLEHLRSKGPHVRGCAALDAVLGRG
jgi:hypothetical protein